MKITDEKRQTLVMYPGGFLVLAMAGGSSRVYMTSDEQVREFLSSNPENAARIIERFESTITKLRRLQGEGRNV